jgi:hypothetical protein
MTNDMLKLYLWRRWLSEKSTIGELYLNPKDEGNRGFQCYTLEDKFLGDEVKDKGRSCIPNGTYSVEFRHSPKFGQELPVIFTRKEPNGIYVIESPLKKVRFEQCMFHAGNVPEHTEGCPLVGQERGTDRIDFSNPALAALLQRLRWAMGRGQLLFPLQVSLKSPFE